MLGNLSLAGLHNVLAAPSLANTDIPDILYACFGFTFVTATAMILAGAMLERGRLFPSMLFLLCWTTFVYYILAYFEWNPSGWLYQLGVLDFAGSGPVHIASGFAALAWSLMLGPRLGDHDHATRQKIIHHKPHNPFLVMLGTCFIWTGWFAFNGGFVVIVIQVLDARANNAVFPPRRQHGKSFDSLHLCCGQYKSCGLRRWHRLDSARILLHQEVQHHWLLFRHHLGSGWHYTGRWFW